MLFDSRWRWSLIAVALLLANAALVPALYSRPRATNSAEMEVVVPRFAQVVMAAGDRFFAADLAGFRALVASTEHMDSENYRILGIVQSDVAWFNPAHEDNYYIAAAILPWFGELEAAQRILKSANEARPFDWQPAFYYAFNALHFEKSAEEGARWLNVASSHASDEMERIQLQQMAALWAAKGESYEFAAHLHRAMAKDTKHKSFARFLDKRAQRFENLLALERAIDVYIEKTGHMPSGLNQLVEEKVLSALPEDPFGVLYVMGQDGKPTTYQEADSRAQERNR